MAIPSIIAPIAVVTDFAPSSLVPSNCKKALDNANKPSDAKAIPAPTPIVARPNKVKEPAKAVIEGITGVNNAAAIPNVAKVPAKATNDFINPSQEIVLKFNIGGTNKFSAAETAITAATPPKQPFINCIAWPNINKDPPIPAKPFTIPSHVKPLKLTKALDKVTNAVATPVKPNAVHIVSFGIIFNAILISVKAIPVPNNDFVNPSQDIDPIVFIASPIIFKAVPTSINPKANVGIFLGRVFKLIDISANEPPIPRSPFPIEAKSILPKELNALPKVIIAPDIIPKATLDFIIFSALPVKLLNKDISANAPPIPASPLAIELQSMLPMFCIA